jgi:GntR family transcriptional regulator
MPKATPLNRSSYEPAYMQLVNILRQQIAAGIYRPHNRLPAEAQLCKQYRISPLTVRRAVNVLLDQGVGHTVQGQGTFVRP